METYGQKYLAMWSSLPNRWDIVAEMRTIALGGYGTKPSDIWGEYLGRRDTKTAKLICWLRQSGELRRCAEQALREAEEIVADLAGDYSLRVKAVR